MIRAIKNKGAIFIEYALILSFVVIGGWFFISSNGFSGNIANIFGKTESLLEATKSFADKYPNNNATKFTEFALQFVQVDKDNPKGSKDALRGVFNKMKNNSEIAFDKLSDTQKEDLKNAGLNTDDFPYAVFYKDDAGRWYACWTGEDLSKKKENQQVKVMTYSLSGIAANPTKFPYSNLSGFYVGTPTYANGSFTNGQISYNTETTSRIQYVSMSDPQYGYTYHANATKAQEDYDSRK